MSADRTVICIEGREAKLRARGFLRDETVPPVGFVSQRAWPPCVKVEHLPDGRLRMLFPPEEAAQRDVAFRRFLDLAMRGTCA